MGWKYAGKTSYGKRGYYKNRLGIRGKDERLYDENYKKFLKIVKKRDKYTCCMPDCHSKKRLQVHHILRWADCPTLRYEPTNGITLCKCCHEKIKNQEHIYIELFNRIVTEKYDNPN